jgi:hypothetical protein
MPARCERSTQGKGPASAGLGGADPRHDPPDTREQSAASDRGSRAIPSRVARILWLLPDPTSAHPPGGMDPPKATSVPLAATAKRPQPLKKNRDSVALPKFHAAVAAGSPTAHVRTSGRPTGSAQPVFRRSRSSPPLRSPLAWIIHERVANVVPERDRRVVFGGVGDAVIEV